MNIIRYITSCSDVYVNWVNFMNGRNDQLQVRNDHEAAGRIAETLHEVTASSDTNP